MAIGGGAGGGGSSSPTTTRGDIIARGASADIRVALGASGTIVSSDGADTIFRTAAALSLATTVTTTRGDIITRGASADQRVALGASGTIVSSDGTDTLFRTAAALSLMTDPLTTRGDIITRGAAATQRVALGASGTIVSSDGTDTLFRTAAALGLVATTGSVTLAYTAVGAANVLLGATHYFVTLDASAAPRTATLPTAVGITGRTYVVKKLGTGVNAVTITPDGSETIDGAASLAITLQNDTNIVVSDGANWQRLVDLT